LLRTMGGIAMDSSNEPMVSLEMTQVINLPSVDNPKGMNVTLRGLLAKGIAMRNMHVAAGRWFQAGRREIVVGKSIAQRYPDAQFGHHLHFGRGDWQIVGNFDIGHTGGNCIVFADAAVVLSTFSRDNYNQINVRLESPERAAELSSSIAANPALHVAAKSEAELTEEGTKQLNAILAFVAYFVGSIMAVAATLGAANSLYAVVDGRRRELATLRALGFRSFPIIASMMTEAMLLSLPGALLGVGLAWLLFNGLTASPFGLSFQLAVTAPIAAVGICWALVMGLVGGVLPALRAARVPVTAALRAT